MHEHRHGTGGLVEQVSQLTNRISELSQRNSQLEQQLSPLRSPNRLPRRSQSQSPRQTQDDAQLPVPAPLLQTRLDAATQRTAELEQQLRALSKQQGQGHDAAQPPVALTINLAAAAEPVQEGAAQPQDLRHSDLDAELGELRAAVDELEHLRADNAACIEVGVQGTH